MGELVRRKFSSEKKKQYRHSYNFKRLCYVRYQYLKDYVILDTNITEIRQRYEWKNKLGHFRQRNGL